MNITEFLLARIAEDEAAARAVIATVAPEEWENPTKWGNFYPEDIAFWDQQTPARVLAECVAKRALCTLHSPGDYRGQLVCDDCGDWWDGSPVDYPCETIKTLAVIYRDHPDYRQEWTP